MRLAEERWLKVDVLKPLPAQSKLAGKILISIPKKVVAKAVSRNRIKRVLRVAALAMPKPGADKIVYLKVVRDPKTVSVESARDFLKKVVG